MSEKETTRLYNGITNIDDDIIEGAQKSTVPALTQVRSKRKVPVWTKLIAAAVCLALVATSIIYLPRIIPIERNPWQDDPIRPLSVIEYNGAYYEAVDMTDIALLDKYKLPHEITADMIGASLGTGFFDTDRDKQKTFYAYEPYSGIFAITAESNQKQKQRAVFVIQNNDKFSFVLFSNFVASDTDTHTEIIEILAVYGIDEAEDIELITLGENEISDSVKVKSIFDNFLLSQAMDNDEYQSEIFGDKSEEEQQKLSQELADSMVEIQLLTAEGIVINSIRYYPTINYVTWASNYYKLGTSLN